ncbi:MAG: hypothetical protein NC340_06940 [Ruminococcus flavefaciens]|nr:hypothetical protein [Ruminococcus flavefaciens]MCM1230409.1 hypothetical protein [Ruminococcus flavefaciens]
MKYNEFSEIYKRITGNDITRDEVNNKILIIIDKVKSATDIHIFLKEITLKVIDDRIYFMKTGHQKHSLTKNDYKKAIDVLSKIAEKDIKNEQEKMFLKCITECIKQSIDNADWYYKY